MRGMQFPYQFILWVKNCVSTPMFSIMIKGVPEGFFVGKRGLRQADPFSPYLFLLVMEALSALIKYKVHHQPFSFHPKCQHLRITHLIFADDLFVVCGAKEDSFSVEASEGIPSVSWITTQHAQKFYFLC